MIKELKDFLSKLEKTDFKFSAASLTYNPMERFAEYVSTKEIIHSKIIAELLNPMKGHHLDYGFLIKFLKRLGIEVDARLGIEVDAQPLSQYDNSTCIEAIQTEFSAPVYLDGIFYDGSIDIFIRLIHNGVKYAVIVENKLNDADDMYRQLERYNKFVEEKYPDYHRLSVYMPRVGTECKYESATVINSTDLAELIDEAIVECPNAENISIQAYSSYLKNISKYNIIMDNAKILAKMSTDDIQKAKAIKDAYDKLPEAFALYVAQTFKEKYKVQISPKYPNYCYIWDEDEYRINNLWLAVGFTHESYSIYVVSNNKSTYMNYLEALNLSVSRSYVREIWLRPKDDNEFTEHFASKPDFNLIKQYAMNWLSRLKQVNL